MFSCTAGSEKSLKAIIIAEKLELTKTHNIKVLFDKLNLIHKIPENLMEAAILTDYAVTSRYPGIFETVTEEEYHSAISLAQNVVDWAMDLLAKYEF
jgi:HEPN domain-containing protein